MQLRFPTMHGLKPPAPTICDERVALRVAERLVAAVNINYFYWPADEVEERITDVWREIVRVGRPATVFSRLDRQAPDGPYGWEGTDEYCRKIAGGIAAEVLGAAKRRHKERHG